MHAVDAGLDRRDVDGYAGRAAVEGRAHRPHHRHRRVRPRREPGRRTTARAPSEPVTMMEYDASIAYRHPDHRRTSSAPKQASERRPVPRPAVPGVQPHLHRWPRLLPDRRDRADRPSTRSTCRRPAWSPTTRSSRPPSTRARRRPSRSPGCTSGSTAPTWCWATRRCIEVPNDQIRIGMRVKPSGPGGREGSRRQPAHGGRPDRLGPRPASPTSPTPTSSTRLQLG